MSRKFLTPIVLPADPAAAMEAATKQYVDNRPAGDEVWIGTSDPGAAYELWYDTDEPNLYEPDTARWNSAWGVVASYTDATDRTGITTTETTVNSGTFTGFVAGRKYSLMVRQPVGKSVATDTVYLRAYIGGSLVVFTESEMVTATRVYQLPSIVYTAATGGSKLVSVTVARGAGTGTVGCLNNTYINAWIDVIDEGPVSLASSPPAQPSSVWTAPTLLNGWANSGAPHQTCQYRLLGDKVELRGRINLGTMNTSIFTLPVGYRPLATTTLATGSVVSGSWAFGVVEVTTDGSVAVYSPASNQGVVLNNLSFSVTA